MGILITPETPKGGGDTCYTYPLIKGQPAEGSNSAYKRICPGTGTTISTGFGITTVTEVKPPEVIKLCRSTYDDCAEEGASEPDEDGCIVSYGPCNDCYPDEDAGVTEEDCAGCEIYQIQTTTCDDCTEEYQINTKLIDPKNNVFKDAFGWKFKACRGDGMAEATVYLEEGDGQWYHACIGDDEEFGSAENNLPVFQNGTDNIIVWKKNSNNYRTIKGTPGVLDDSDSSTANNCIEYFVHNTAGVFSADEVMRNKVSESESGVASQTDIPANAAIFWRSCAPFHSDKAFTINVQWKKTFCIGESDQDTNTKDCLLGSCIVSVYVDANNTCSVLENNIMNNFY